MSVRQALRDVASRGVRLRVRS